jgi:thiamine biosynthesis protein ThiI
MKVIICRYGEIHLKGGNRGLFMRALKNEIKRKLVGFSVDMADARITISNFADDDINIIVNKLKTVFGLTSISVSEQIPYTTPDDLLSYISKLSVVGNFKVEVNRADKTFPIKSPIFSAQCGDTVCKNNANAVVNVTNPQTLISIDIRNNGVAFIFNNTIKGLGGLPVGVSGRALCLISGGIDSPVSAFLSAKRGLNVDFVHFASPPYTSEQALEKVKTLCRQVCKYTGRANLYIVPFTKIQQDIREHCRAEFMITIMRRFMIAIAEKIGLTPPPMTSPHCADCLITGENLAQVASQTIQGITTNNFVATKLPILRPLICFDKTEIIALAKQIGTYETSILPYADCCTVFVPQHPAIKPTLVEVERECQRLDLAKLINTAYSEICRLQITCEE